MKIFLLDTLNKYKRISKCLDTKTILCNKSWQVFNNSVEKEIYIFQEDGSLIISFNGKAIIARWSFIPANDTVLISHNDSSFMMKPFFYDDNLFVLQLDGTNEYSFLIDELQKSAFPLKTLNELESHMKERYELEERGKIEAELRRIAQDAQEKRNREIEAEKIRLENEENEIFQRKMKYVDQLWEEQKKDVLSKDEYYSRYWWVSGEMGDILRALIIPVLFISLFIISIIFIAAIEISSITGGILILLSCIPSGSLSVFITYKLFDTTEKKLDKVIYCYQKAFYLNHGVRLERD